MILDSGAESMRLQCRGIVSRKGPGNKNPTQQYDAGLEWGHNLQLEYLNSIVEYVPAQSQGKYLEAH